MNHNKKENLPLIVLGLGAAACLVRGLLYLLAADDTGLLIRGHGLWWLLWVLFAAAAVAVSTVIPRKGSNRFEDNFGPSTLSAAGSLAMAVGILLTLLAGNTMPRPLLVYLWYISGILAAAGLVWTALCAKQGTAPNVLCCAVLCLFFALHMVSRYQPWSGQPQSQDWIFSLLGSVGLILCAYHRGAFSAGCGQRRSFLATGLLTVFFCCAALPHTDYFWLYLCGGIWAYTGLGRIAPVPEPAERS